STRKKQVNRTYCIREARGLLAGNSENERCGCGIIRTLGIFQRKRLGSVVPNSATPIWKDGFGGVKSRIVGRPFQIWNDDSRFPQLPHPTVAGYSGLYG